MDGNFNKDIAHKTFSAWSYTTGFSYALHEENLLHSLVILNTVNGVNMLKSVILKLGDISTLVMTSELEYNKYEENYLGD